MAGNGFISVVLEFDFQIIVIPTPHAETSRATTRKITAIAAHPSINSSAPVEARHDMRTNKRAIGAASREKPWPPPHQRQTPQNTPMIVSHQLRQWRRRCSAATQALITRRLSTPTLSEKCNLFQASLRTASREICSEFKGWLSSNCKCCFVGQSRSFTAFAVLFHSIELPIARGFV